MSNWFSCFSWRKQKTTLESAHSFNANSVTFNPVGQDPRYAGYRANQGTDEGGYEVPVDYGYSGYIVHGQNAGDPVYAEADNTDSGR